MLGPTAWIADADNLGIFAASKPGAPAPELTIKGNYTAQVAVTLNPTFTQTAAFAINKVTPTISITSPVDGSAIVATNLDSNGEIDVTGSVNDKTMAGKTVTIGVVIPDQEIFASAVTSADASSKWSSTGLWHVFDVTTSGSPIEIYPAAPDNEVWWYGQDPPQNNYQTGNTNNGALVTVVSGDIPVLDASTKLFFWTWWHTEFGDFFDKKLIQVSKDGGSTWESIAQIVDPGFGGFFPGGPGPGSGPSCGLNCNYVNIAPGPFAKFGTGAADKGWSKVDISLSDFVGDTLKVRFFFDTGDPFANEAEGWFVDDVKVTGQSSSGKTSTIQSDLSFTGKFAPNEGKNTISASSIRDAYETTSVSTSVDVFLDNTVPELTVDAVTSPTSTNSQTLTGTIKDPTADQLEILLSNADVTPAVTNLSVAIDKSPSTDGTWSLTINLFEGTNNLSIEATDKGGNKTTKTAAILLDTQGPTLTIFSTQYPVGEVSARPGDLAVFQVKADDTASGVAKVEVDLLGTLTQFVERSTIPDFFLDQWGVDATATHILPVNMPTLLATGTATFSLTVTDNGGNTDSTKSATATILPSLTKFNIYLLEGWSLVSSPLTLTNNNWSNAIPAPDGDANTILDDAVTIVWFYDAETASWKLYQPGGASNTLTKFLPGRGYWINVDGAKLGTASEVAPGVSVKPPAKLTVAGTFLQPGVQGLPPITDVFQGWNLIGFHSENDQLVSQGLQAVTVGPSGQIWASLLQFDNMVEYKGSSTPEISLGSFSGLTLGGTMKPGTGFWIFMLQDGQIVPTN